MKHLKNVETWAIIGMVLFFGPAIIFVLFPAWLEWVAEMPFIAWPMAAGFLLIAGAIAAMMAEAAKGTHEGPQ